MENYKNTIEFIDEAKRRAIVDIEITNRNKYPEFTMSGRYEGSWGQCLDSVKPKGLYQTQLIELWHDYHLKNVSSVHCFKDNLVALINNIEAQEKEREENDKTTEEEKLSQMMEEYGIDEDEKEACEAYISIMGSGTDLRDFQESYSGQYDSVEEFAQEQAESCGLIDNTATWPNNCIDWEQAGRELMYDYCEQNGYYFRNL